MWAGYRTRFPTGAIIHVVSGPLIQLPISDGAANETENSGWLKKNCSLRENHTYSHLKYWCLNVWVCVFVCVCVDGESRRWSSSGRLAWRGCCHHDIQTRCQRVLIWVVFIKHLIALTAELGLKYLMLPQNLSYLFRLLLASLSEQ